MNGTPNSRDALNSATVQVAALFVETNGVYFGLDDVDPWDAERDARLYSGPYPVVAHPPCTRWSIMGQCRGLRDGRDEGCFVAALWSVQTFGGVLEHPANTLAWQRYRLPRPGASGWTRSLFGDGWTCLVDQRHYGLRARKPTWLYYVGTEEPPALIWGRGPRGTFGTQHKRAGTIASSHHGDGTDRSGTPPAFRDVLLDMARSARVSEVAA